MKKILTSIAMVLLLAGCAKQYDDSALQTRIADLERRVTSLESSVDALRSAIGEGVFVVKVQEYVDPDTGKTIGVTVNYNNGDVKYFEITPKVDYSGPVVSIITNGAGELVWAVDGQAVQVGGKDVTVYQTPVFTIDEDGYLWVEINGEKVKLGQVQNEGATLVDGIFTDIKVEQDKIVLTLSDDTVVNIPFATAFKLSIETDDVVYEKRGEAIEVPYQVSGKTEKTVVDVTGYDPNYFDVEVTAEKIIITPLTAESAAVMSVIADSKVGLVSVAKLCVNFETATVIDPETGWVDYVISSDGGSIVANMISNVEIEAVPDDETDWITIVETKAMNAHTITMTVAANTETDSRMGYINVFKKGTEKHLETLYIYQEAFVEGPKDLSKDGTANCYIVTEAGDYKFKAVKGNSTESVGTVDKAEILWETYNDNNEVTANSVIASVSYKDGYVIFSTPATLKPGNALVAAKDANGVILWSWHIWIPETAIADVSSSAMVASEVQTVMMDRNLGALVAATKEGATVYSYGLYYQWGRKDPFPAAKRVDSGSPALVAGTAITVSEALLSSDDAIKQPTVIGFASGANDWLNPSDMTRWVDAEKTVNDPCPVGYRVPKRNKNWAYMGSNLETAEGWVYSAENHFFALGDPALVFPLAGFRKHTKTGFEISQSGIGTVIWTAYSSTGGQAYTVQYDGDEDRDGKKARLLEWKNGTTASVRCVAE